MAVAHPLDFTTMVENVAPNLRDKLREVFTPQGTGPVASSANFIFIVCLAMQGDTPNEISEKLEKEKKQYIAPQAIRNYILGHIPPELMRPNMVLQYFSQMAPIPELTIIETALKMQSVKVAKLIDMPLVTVEERESSRRDLELLVKVAEVSLKTKVELGIVKTGLQAPNDSQVQQHFHKHEHVIMTDPRKATAALQAVEKIKRLASKNIDVQEVKPDDKPSG